MMNRTQYRNQRSRWTEVPLGWRRASASTSGCCFLLLHGVGYGEDFKVSFALLGLQFITPWFTVVDDAHSLSRVELTLRAAGDTVISAQWLDEYIDGRGGARRARRPRRALEHGGDVDPDLAFGLLAVVGVLWLALALYLAVADRAQGRKMLSAGTLATGAFGAELSGDDAQIAQSEDRIAVLAFRLFFFFLRGEASAGGAATAGSPTSSSPSSSSSSASSAANGLPAAAGRFAGGIGAAAPSLGRLPPPRAERDVRRRRRHHRRHRRRRRTGAAGASSVVDSAVSSTRAPRMRSSAAAHSDDCRGRRGGAARAARRRRGSRGRGARPTTR